MKKIAIALCLLMFTIVQPALASPKQWKVEGWKTDFSKFNIDFSEILSGGPPRDGIPSIDAPKFEPASAITTLDSKEAVIRVELNGNVRAYPLRILIWHEIANDEIGGTPVAVTYCPLCNSSIAFDRRLSDGTVAEFGVSGLLRNSDMVMYDRASHSWWQQFTGTAIAGQYTDTKLKMIPTKVVSFGQFLAENPESDVLVPNDPTMRRYGTNPYLGYDARQAPYPFYKGDLPDNISPMARIIVVQRDDNEVIAVALSHLRAVGSYEIDDIRLKWQPGVNSALDSEDLAIGADVGAVEVESISSGEPLVHDITFAFVVQAFHPGTAIATEDGPIIVGSRP